MGAAHRKARAKAVFLCSLATAAAWAHAGVTSSWILPTGGSWTDPAAWSTAPNYPNNGMPPGTTYDAVIADTSIITISLDTDVTLDTFTLNSIIANFDLNAGVLEAGTISLLGGGFNMNGGTLRNALVTSEGGAGGGISVSNNRHGKIDHITLRSNLNINGNGAAGASLTINNGVQLENGATIVVRAGTVNFAGTQTVSGSGTISGTFDRMGLAPNAGTTTLGPGITVSRPALSGGEFYITGSGTLINNGTMNVGVNTVINPQQRFVNNGTAAFNASVVDARHFDNNGRMSISGTVLTLTDWTNSGTLTHTGGNLTLTSLAGNVGTLEIGGFATLTLNGTYQGSDLSRIRRSSFGSILLTGTLDNTGATLSLSSPPVQFAVQSPGKITGGTITSNGTMQVAFNNGTIENATFSGRFVNLGAATLSNITLADATISSSATLRVAGGTTSLSGVGTFENVALANVPGSPLVIPAGVTSRTGGSFVTTAAPFRNRGHIRVPLGTTTTINSADWRNEGSITLGGQLIVSGQAHLSDFGTINRASTGQVLLSSGGFDLENSTLDLATFGTLTVGGGSISNGTILSGGGYDLKISGSATLSNVATNNDLFPSQLTYAGNGTLLNGSSIYLSGGTVTLANGRTIGGDGSIKFLTGGNISVLGAGTFGSNINIATVGAGGTIDGAWTNDGTITCNFGTLSLKGDWRNNGVLRVDGGDLQLDGTFHTDTLGTIVKTGGVISLVGTLFNAENSFDPSALPVVPKGGTISGGKVYVANPDAIPVNVANASFFTLSLVTLETDLQGQLMQRIRFANALTLDDKSITIWPGTNPNTGSWSAGGNGTIVFETSLSAPNGSSTLTLNAIGPNVLLRTGVAPPGSNGATVTLGTASANFTNSGTILSHSPNMAINTISTGSFTNNGFVIVRNVGTFSTGAARTTNFGSNTLTGGTWIVETGGTIALTGGTIVTNASTVTINGATSRFDAMNTLRQNNGTFTLAGGKTFSTVNTATLGFGNAGLLVIGSGSSVAIDGSLTNTGTIDVNDSLIIDHAAATPSPYPQIAAQIITGRNGGAWDGATTPQFTSSVARNASPRAKTLGLLSGDQFLSIYGPGATFATRAVDASSLLIKSTFYGDADFSGTVNFDDYSRIDDGFNNGGTDWFRGDFDLNGTVNFDDYALIDLAFNTQDDTLFRALLYLNGDDRSTNGMDAPALQMVMDHFDVFGESYATTFNAFAPEPTVGACVVPMMLLLSSRIRRRGKGAARA